ncbi:hypothetical protein [Terriglobus roseus]|uniref:Uncharacterized protein n=1 Tax=Terriglobus roseus TaxID=392734 RepID=A0A1H4JSB5_9BACT|nr:hypothetical protein [Terriglobus roseus]SEB48876.1 hypothetical protein SAMN05443244_0775 [Terriglobus roseus]
MKATIEGNELVIRIQLLPEPTRSKSGKTMLVATSGGNVVTEAMVDGKPITVGLNAYIPK